MAVGTRSGTSRALRAYRRTIAGVASVLLALSSMGCGEPDVVLHPPVDVIRESTAGAAKVSPRLSDGIQRDLPLASSLESATAARSIGTGDGPSHEVFGKVGFVVVSGDTLFVADVMANEIRVFHWDGSYLGTIGGPGSGPGEYRMLVGAARVPGGLIVVSQGSGVQRFEERAEGWVETSRHNLSVPTVLWGGACLIGEELFLRTLAYQGDEKYRDVPQAMVAVLDPTTGDRLRQIGSPDYLADAWIVNVALTQGRMACDPKERLVVVGMDGFPFVRGFDAETGQVRWTSVFPDITWKRVRETPRGSAGLTGDGWHLRGMVTVPEGGTLVQVGQDLDPETGEPVRTREAFARSVEAFRTYLISNADGRGGFVSSTLPRIVAVTARGFVTLSRTPWPTLHLHELK